jgi:hypothetical protein
VPQIGKPGPILYFYLEGGGYSDHIGGAQVAAIDGRVSGLLAKVSATYAPFGLKSAIGVVPVLDLSAQVQSDRNAGGGRVEETRRLYRASLSMNFGVPDKQGPAGKTSLNKLQPSLVLSRTLGADLLSGRPKAAVTELVLSLKY